MNTDVDLTKYLESTYFIDCDTPSIKAYAAAQCHGKQSELDRAVALYYAVRDDIRYDPYSMQDKREGLRASSVLKKKAGFCVPKAILLAAVLRSQGIPARPGFADVKNHLSTQRLSTLMQTDLFVYHGYVEILISNIWVKATPAFNLSLCRNFKVKPLDFDGREDSLFHEFDEQGNRHMEYVADHGTYADVPYEMLFTAYRQYYPKILALNAQTDAATFSREATVEHI
jgi:transglutaminase-like putative cysteine protease